MVDLVCIREIPVVNTAARGRAAITLNTVTRVAQIYANVSGADDATGAHLHRGVAA